jgi:hypothetical protein
MSEEYPFPEQGEIAMFAMPIFTRPIAGPSGLDSFLAPRIGRRGVLSLMPRTGRGTTQSRQVSVDRRPVQSLEWSS